MSVFDTAVPGCVFIGKQTDTAVSGFDIDLPDCVFREMQTDIAVSVFDTVVSVYYSRIQAHSYV